MSEASKIPRRLTLAAALAVWAASGVAAQAQTWTVRMDGASLGTVEAASREAATEAALTLAAAVGRALAVPDTLARDGQIALVGGPTLIVGEVALVGTRVLPDETVTARWATRPGAPYVPARLNADLEAAVARYAAAGLADARLVARTTVAPVGADTLRVNVAVDVVEGAAAEIAGVELVGARRPARAFATRITGLLPGTPLARFDAESVRQSLDATGLYAAVGAPALARERDGRVTIRVPVEPAPPGAFDLVAGWLPPSAGQRGRVVGSGRLELTDALGGGQTVLVGLERNPGLVSRIALAASDPFVAGLPFGLAAAFDGETRDSTFSRQAFAGEVSARVAPGLTVALSVAREGVLPGRAANVPGAAPLVRRSTVFFGGASVRFVRVDRVLAPRRGATVRVSVESGVRRRAASLEADSLSGDALTPRQQRLGAAARVYQPLGARAVLVGGLDARLLVSGRGAGGEGAVAYDEGELFRIGGASTLRGYDEEAFVGRGVGRVLAEARWLFDDVSFGFFFADVGYVVRPDLPTRPGSTRTRPGYGAGLRVATALGPVTVTYALNPDLPLTSGKLHIGLRVGL